LLTSIPIVYLAHKYLSKKSRL
ncbi:hypothetical protein EHRUM2_02850, partial [Ehrlichia ruminantium]